MGDETVVDIGVSRCGGGPSRNNRQHSCGSPRLKSTKVCYLGTSWSHPPERSPHSVADVPREGHESEKVSRRTGKTEEQSISSFWSDRLGPHPRAPTFGKGPREKRSVDQEGEGFEGESKELSSDPNHTYSSLLLQSPLTSLPFSHNWYTLNRSRFTDTKSQWIL